MAFECVRLITTPSTSTPANGILVQFQTHWNETEPTIYFCHTSCDVLNVSTLESYLTRVTAWLQRHPYDVITILMGNSDTITPDEHIAPVTSSGLINYVYTPPNIPMSVSDWLTLQERIFSNTRAVMMLDYQANQQQIPWLLDEFGQMFETPFSPTNRDFPCTADRRLGWRPPPRKQNVHGQPQPEHRHLLWRRQPACPQYSNFERDQRSSRYLRQSAADLDRLHGHVEPAPDFPAGGLLQRR